MLCYEYVNVNTCTQVTSTVCLYYSKKVYHGGENPQGYVKFWNYRI